MKAAVLTMTTSSRDLQAMTSQETSSTSQQEDRHAAHRPSHSGLSALLSAVTLQLSESKDESKNDPSPSSTHAHNPYTPRHNDESNPSSFVVVDNKKKPNSTTPTMMPERHNVANPSFPHTLMTLLIDPDNHNIITFLPDGKYFALRADTFSSTLMERYFGIDRWESFLEKLSSWGFERIATNIDGVEVFRHPMFAKGDWKRCGDIQEGPNHSQPAALSLSRPNSSSSAGYDDPTKSGERLSLATTTNNTNNESFKRRLSPAHAEKVTATTSKARIQSTEDEEMSQSNSNTTTNTNPLHHHHHPKNDGSSSLPTTTTTSSSSDRPSSAGRRRRLSSDDCRSLAVTIATEKLKLEPEDKEAHHMPLVSQGVFGATHTIVTDAIETLLRDEDHTRETFQKHADELSKSSLPGLVPISKQLFCKKEDTNKDNNNNDNSATGGDSKPAAKK